MGPPFNLLRTKVEGWMVEKVGSKVMIISQKGWEKV